MLNPDEIYFDDIDGSVSNSLTESEELEEIMKKIIKYSMHTQKLNHGYPLNWMNLRNLLAF